MWRCILWTALSLLLFRDTGPAFAALSPVPPPGGETYLAARRAQSAGRAAEAIGPLESLIAEDGPLRPFAAQALADAARRVDDAGRLLLALETWAESERIPAVRLRAHRTLGEHLMTIARPADAAVAFQYWVEHPEDARDRSRARWALAQAHRAAAQPELAEPLLWRIIHDDPTSVQARDALDLLPAPAGLRRRYEVGYVHLKHRNWAKADATLTPLIDEPLSDAFQAQVLYAWAEVQRHTVSRAESRRAMYQLALAYPRSGYARKAWQSIASSWSRDQRYAEAIAAYDDVVDHAPRHDAAVQAMWDAAKLRMRTDPRAAATRLAILQAMYPRHVLADDALRLRGLALYRDGDYAAAAEAFREGYTRYPNRRTADDCAYWEGKCALALGETEAAQAAFTRTMEGWPNDFYAFRAAQQLERLRTTGDDPAPQPFVIPAAHDQPRPGHDEPPFPAGQADFPAAGADWLGLFAWFHANGLPEARDVVPELRRFARTPAQQFRVAQLAAAAGDYEACIWLADSVRKAVGVERVPALAPLLYPEAWLGDLRAHGRTYRVDPYLPLAVMREESHFRDTVDSSAGARGVMQIMPRTGAWLGTQVREAGPYTHDRLYEVPYNIHLGTYYLAHLLRQFDEDVILAVAAYNGGPGNVRRWIKRYGLADPDLFIESIPYDETSEYVKKVLGSYGTYHRLAAAREGTGE